MALKYEWTNQDKLLFKECIHSKKQKQKEYQTKATTKKVRGKKGRKEKLHIESR